MNAAWLKPALLGVDGAVTVSLDGEIGDLVARVANVEDAALGFSRAAATIAACARASIPLATASPSPPAPADADTRVPAANHPWLPALASALRGALFQQEHILRLKVETCLRLAEVGATLPHTLLVPMLDAGQRHAALRPALLPVLGQRGRWLAAQNPDWKYAASNQPADDTSTAADTWNDGAHPQRLAWFQQLRADDAARARDLLGGTLAELPAKERLDFVRALDTALHADDITLLAPLLKDRSRDVRFAAARLLACLPESAHARQLLAWIDPLLTSRKGLLSRSWQIEPPTAAEPAWTTAAIDAQRPQYEPLGERAWWLYQLVRQVPLAWWVQRTGMRPDELVGWAARTDWNDALLRGWRERVGPDTQDWIEALLGAKEQFSDDARLLAMLPVATRERHWPTTLDALIADALIGDVVGAHAFGETLSARYSAALLPSLLACFASDRLRHDYGLRSSLLDLASVLHPQPLQTLQALQRTADETPAMAECAAEFERIVRIRAVLHTSF